MSPGLVKAFAIALSAALTWASFTYHPLQTFSDLLSDAVQQHQRAESSSTW